MKTYDVKRHHIGSDGLIYSPDGENRTREAIETDVAHLVASGVLAEREAAAVTPLEPQAPVQQTKAKSGAPENK